MIKWLMRAWRRRQRSIDIDILWPCCKKATGGDAAKARLMMLQHAFIDEAWSDQSPEEINKIVEGLS